MAILDRFPRYIIAIALFLTIVSAAQAKYSGGTGEPNDPYQIATAEDLMLLGETPEDYDKHFILTADIDFDPNLPGRKVFDKAVIAPDTDDATTWFEGTAFIGVFDGRPFTGVFDGDWHTISHLMIIGEDYLGLFGCLGSTAIVANLGLEAVEIRGENYLGGLVGSNSGSVTTSYSSGSVSGESSVGGLVGSNGGSITNCYSSGSVTGKDGVGGLVGVSGASITMSYSSGSVSGTDHVGGLVGGNGGSIATSYSNSSVNGRDSVGGFVGSNYGAITTSYSTGSANGESRVGGLVGYLRRSYIAMSYSSATVFGKASVGGLVGSSFDSNPGRGFVRSCFWDIETSGQTTSAWGWTTGKTTTEMQDPKTFMAAGWDFVGQPDGPHDIWAEPKGGGYPILWWQQSPLPELPAFGGGTGEPNNPYLISTAKDLNSIGHNPRLMKCHFRLVADLDLAGLPLFELGDYYHPFDGVFDAGGKIIRDLPCTLFGYVDGTIKRLCLVDPNCAGSPIRSNNGTIADCCVQGGRVMGPGGLVDSNYGSITRSYNTAALSGDSGGVGGLVRSNSGSITDSYSTGMVTSTGDAGGLVCSNGGRITRSFSTGIVIGTGQGGRVGGLVAGNSGSICDSYSLGTVTGIGLNYVAGGLVGWNVSQGSINRSYNTGTVSGSGSVGGLVGSGGSPTVTDGVWDVEASGLSKSSGGVGLTTAEMMNPYMLGLNGFANDPNWILDTGRDYPHLAWEDTRGDIIPEPDIDWLDGQGTEDKPFRISTAEQLILIGKASIFWDKYLILDADIDLDPALPARCVFGQALIQTFTGIFDGNGHTISHLTITGEDYLGLLGQLESLGEVKHLAMRDVSIAGAGDFVGGLLGSNRGRATQCYSTGSVSGDWNVGGLVGWNYGSIATSYSSSSVHGNQNIGGFVGGNGGAVSECYSTGAAIGNRWSGGFLGRDDSGTVTSVFWDIQTSGQFTSADGTGKITSEMHTAKTFLEAGWDFVDETANGTDDIWWILEGQDYPRLWWELITEN